MEYLSLPFSLDKGYLNKVDLYESISFSVGLILSTRIGSIAFEPGYGCEIWDKEFSDMQSTNRGDIRASVRHAIGKYEKRLHHVSVSMENVDVKSGRPLGIVIKVSGKFDEDGKEKKFEEIFATG
jgi:phage baseplate assembly protein W